LLHVSSFGVSHDTSVPSSRGYVCRPCVHPATADRICFLEQSVVKEAGCHDELVGLGGGYARMFTIQAERYLPFLDGTP
jgi:hypothetical protein